MEVESTAMSESDALLEEALHVQIADSEVVAKDHAIRQACANQDFRSLVSAATSRHGLIEDDLRVLAWPILLGCDNAAVITDSYWKELPAHKDEEQVALDVHRSFVFYPNDPTAQMAILKLELSNLIVSVLRTHPLLSYFQGYHDIAQVLLLVLGPDLAKPALARISLLRIRDFMLPSLSGAISQLHLLPALLRVSDPSLAKYLPSNPFWALAATLTLYAHDVQSYAHIARLFDFILAQPAVATLYLYAAVIKSRRDDLLDIDPNDEDILHVTLTKLPSNRMDFDQLIEEATDLLSTYPPDSLGSVWRNISASSVLRTAADAESVRGQSLIEGETWLGYQSREAARKERLRAMYNSTRLLLRSYRRPAFVMLPLAVAIFAVYYGRSNSITADLHPVKGSLVFLWNFLIGRKSS